MTDLVRLLVLVPLGYVAACLVAGWVVAFGIFGFDDIEVVGYFIGAVAVATFYAGTLGFVPAAIAILMAEVFGWRSVFYYLAVGGAIALIAEGITSHFGAFDFAGETLTVFLGAGFAAALAYWAIAGRQAGLGRPSATPSAPA